MSFQARREMGVLCVAACLILALPLSAHATAVLDKVGIEVGPERTGYIAAHDDLVAYTAYRSDPQVPGTNSYLVVGDALTGTTVIDKGTSQLPEIGGFDGDWIGYRAGDMSEQVYAMNIHTGEQILLDESGVVEVTVPLVDNGRAVWGKRPYGSGDPWTYKIRDLSTNVTTVIGTSPYVYESFKGNRLAFARPGTPGGLDLCFLDLSTGVVHTFAYGLKPMYEYQTTWPSLELTDDSAVWATPSTSGSELFRCNLSTLATTSLLKVKGEIGAVSAGDRLVAWAEANSGDTDVFGFDMQTGQAFAVATGAGYQAQPSVAGMRIGYTDDAVAGNNGDVYSALLSYTQPDLGKVTVPKQLKAGAEGKFSVAFTNPDANDKARIVWDFGDGTTQAFDVYANGKSKASHAYSAAGTYEGLVTITDTSGMKDTAKFTVVVR